MTEIPGDPNGDARSPAPPPIALLVEDEALVAMVAEDYLSNLGFSAALVGTGGAALACLGEGLEPVFAMIDMGLPDMRGDELVRCIRTTRPALPVIIVSGYSHDELQARFAHDKAVAIVTKPYTEAQLVRAARSLGVDCAESAAR
jgi:CheY-like chemotaxis protein